MRPLRLKNEGKEKMKKQKREKNSGVNIRESTSPHRKNWM